MKVAIVGTTPSSRLLSQELPPDWKIWVCAPDNVGRLPRVDAWFEIHGDLDHEEEGASWGPYIAWLNQQHFPVYMQHNRLVPRATPFPHEALIREFGTSFFTSTPAWMMAFAIQNGAKEIGLYGLDLAARSEYAIQKPAVHHFIHVAEARGIGVHAPPQSEVLQPPPLYGFQFNTPMGRKLRVREMEIRKQIRELESEVEHKRLKLQHFYGVLDDLDWMQQTWTGRPSVEPVVRTFAADCGKANGAGIPAAETKWFGGEESAEENKTDSEMLRAAE